MDSLDPNALPLGEEVEIRFTGKIVASDDPKLARIQTPDGSLWGLPLNAKIYKRDNIPGKVYFTNLLVDDQVIHTITDMGSHWGPGNEYRPDKCQHTEGQTGCLWCCERCNHDTHLCGGCGTIVGHDDGNICKECKVTYA